MKKLSFSLLSTVSLICMVGFMNQVQAIPETEDPQSHSTIAVKEGGWQETKNRFIFPKFDETTLEGTILNQAMKVKDPRSLFEGISDLCMEDCRRLYSLRKDRDDVVKAQKALIDYKIELIQQLLKEEPITREQNERHDTLRSQYYEFGDKALQAPRANPVCHALDQELPDRTISECFGKFPQFLDTGYLQMGMAAIIHDWANFPDRSPIQERYTFFKPFESLAKELMESHIHWSQVSPEVAMNRSEVFLSVCKNNEVRNLYLDRLRNYYGTFEEPNAAFEQFYKANYKTGGVKLVDKRPEGLAKNPFYKLMKVTPTPLLRAYFTSILNYDFLDVQEYLRSDFPLDLNQSQQEAEDFFLFNFLSRAIGPSGDLGKREQWIHDCLRIVYHNQGINTPFLDVLNSQNPLSRYDVPAELASYVAVNYMRGFYRSDDQETKQIYENVVNSIREKGEAVLRSLNMEIPSIEDEVRVPLRHKLDRDLKAMTWAWKSEGSMIQREADGSQNLITDKVGAYQAMELIPLVNAKTVKIPYDLTVTKGSVSVGLLSQDQGVWLGNHPFPVGHHKGILEVPTAGQSQTYLVIQNNLAGNDTSEVNFNKLDVLLEESPKGASGS